MRQLLVILLATGVTGQNVWPCPPNTQLNGNLGTVDCADGGDPTKCQLPVSPASTCDFSILAPDASYNGAQLFIQASGMTELDSIDVLSSVTNVNDYGFQSNFSLRAAFPFPGVMGFSIIEITVIAGPNSNMTFGYYVQKFVPTFTNPTQLVTGTGQQAQFVQLNGRVQGDYWEVTTTNGSKVTTNAVVAYASNDQELLNFWVYEGVGANRKILGSFYSATMQFTSATNQITILNVMNTTSTLTGTLLLNDLANLQNCDSYEVKWAPNFDFEWNFKANGTVDCMTLVNDAAQPSSVYLTSLAAGDNNTTLVYTGTTQVVAGAPVTDPVAAGSLLATYTPSKTTANSLSLPQLLPGFVRTLVYSSGSGVSHFSTTATSAKDHVPYTGRSGFIMSNNYPMNMPNQNTFFYLNSSTPFPFNFTVQTVLSPATINVYGTAGLVDKIAVTTNSTGLTRSYNDKLVDIDIDGGAGSSSGIYLTYQVGVVPVPTVTCPSSPRTLLGTLGQDWVVAPSNFDCNFTFVIDANSAVEVSVQAVNISAGEVVEVVGVYDTVSSTGSQFLVHAAFPPTTVTVHVRSGVNTTLAFTYTLIRKPAILTTPMTVDLTQFEDAFYLQMASVSKNQTWQISAANTTQVTVISASPANTPSYDFLNFWVYQGTGTNKTLVGSLYQSYKNLWTSTGSTITVYYAMNADKPNIGTLLFNQKYNLFYCTSYSAQWSFGNPTQTIATPDGKTVTVDTSLDASKGPACLTIIDDPTTLGDDPIFTAAISSSDAQPYVMAGAPVAQPSNSSQRYLGGMTSGSKYYFSYPQTFGGSSRTIYLNSGTYQLATTTNKNTAKSWQVYAGRQGFIMSANYPFVDVSQDAQFTLQGSAIFNVTFKVQYSDAPAGAVLAVSNENGTVLNVNMSDPLVTTRSYSVTGQTVSFVLDGGSSLVLDPNRGSYITYQISNDYNPPSTTAAPTTTVAPVTTVSLATGGGSSTAMANSVPATSPTVPPVQTTTSGAGLVNGLLAAVISLMFL